MSTLTRQSKEETVALEMLSAHLTDQANEFQQSAQQGIATTQSETAQLATLVSQSPQKIGTLPAGSRVIATKNTRVETDPITGDISVFKDVAPIPKPAPNPVALEQSIYAAARNPAFDIDKALLKIDTLQGQDRGLYSMQVLTQINNELATRSAFLKGQAMIDARVADAEASVTRFSQAAKLKGIDPTQAYQVVQAQAVLQQALSMAGQKANILLGADEVLGKLNGNARVVTAMIQRQAGMADKAQSEADLATPEAVTNFMALHDTSAMREFDVKRATVKAARNDKLFQQVVDFNLDTAPTLLVSPSAIVRTTALKLLAKRDWALNNPSWPEGTPIPNDIPDSPIIKAIQDAQNVPIDSLVKQFEKSDKARGEITTSLKTGSTKEKEQLTAGLRANYITKIVENFYERSYDNMAGWKLLDSNPLAKTIAAVRSRNKDQSAPMDTVLATFTQDYTILGADGKPMDFATKMGFVQSALNSTAASEPRTMLLRDQAAITQRVLVKVQTQMAKDYAANMRNNFLIDRSNNPSEQLSPPINTNPSFNRDIFGLPSRK